MENLIWEKIHYPEEKRENRRKNHGEKGRKGEGTGKSRLGKIKMYRDGKEKPDLNQKTY